jgi:hypothetical protein
MDTRTTKAAQSKKSDMLLWGVMTADQISQSRMAADALIAWEMIDLVDDTELIAPELFANARRGISFAQRYSGVTMCQKPAGVTHINRPGQGCASVHVGCCLITRWWVRHSGAILHLQVWPPLS